MGIGDVMLNVLIYVIAVGFTCLCLTTLLHHRWFYPALLLFAVISGILSLLGIKGIFPFVLLVGFPVAILRFLNQKGVFLILLYIFVFMAGIGMLRLGTESAFIGWKYFYGYLLGVAFSIVLGMFIDSWRTYELAVKVGITGSLWLVAWNVFYLGSRKPTTIAAYRYGTLVLAERRLPEFLDPNNYAMILLLPFSVALSLFIRSLSRRRLGAAVLWALIAIVSCLGILYSLSRAGIVGLLFTGAFVLLDEGGFISRSRNARAKVGRRAFVVLLLIGVLAITTRSLLAWLDDIGWGVKATTAGDSWATRLRLWQSGLEFIAEDISRLIVGGGLGRVYEAVGDVVHNSYIQVLDDMGVFGFGAFVLLIVAAIWYLWQARRNDSNDVAVGIFWGCVAQVITLSTISAAHLYITWVIVAFGIACNRLFLVRPPSRSAQRPLAPGRVSDTLHEESYVD